MTSKTYNRLQYMNKILYRALLPLAFTLGSCSMDLTPAGEIQDEQALETTEDFGKFTTGIMSQMRGVTSGDYVVLSDIQLDDFHAVIGNGNRRMDFYNGSFNPATGEIGSYYSAFYSVIAQTNFFLQKAEQKVQDESLTPDNRSALQNYLGQVYFVRAYCYNALADKFCGSYKHTADLDASGKGLSLQLKYAPTANNKEYPGRSSMRETYGQICRDLDSAMVNLTRYESAASVVPAANSARPTSDAAKALKARVCLNMGDDAQALSLAKEIIGTTRYTLTDRNSFKTLWADDMGAEVIWLVEADFTYHGSATGSAFASNIQNPDYIPTNDCIYLFDENDTRWNNWFDESKVSNSGGDASVYRFMKYPGNKSLYAQAAGSNFVNKAKPLRSAEMYLVAAEASFNLNDEDMALHYLQTLQKERIRPYSPMPLTGVALLKEIQDERHREMMGEGSRLSDLKRWQLGFTRGEVWEGCDNVVVKNNMNLHYDASDYRLVWPIPQHEMDANPQLKGQQNPGY